MGVSMSHEAFLKEFSVLLLDVDGVWFTGEEIRMVLPSGEVVVGKERHLHDGQGLSFLRAMGIEVAFLATESEPLKSIVEKINALPSVRSGAWKPVSFMGGKDMSSIENWLSARGYAWNTCVYFGDDRDDVESAQKTGLFVCPSNARRVAKVRADLLLSSSGGDGAIREFAERVLDARGLDEATLPPA